LKIVWATLVVAVPGPPLVRPTVMSYTLRKFLNVKMVLMMKNGNSSGKVIRWNCFHALAPSIEAASYTSFGMDTSPARKMMIAPGMATQEATKTMPSQAVCWLARMLDSSGAKWIAPAMIGTELDRMKVKM